MNAYDKLRAKNIAERDAILADLFKEFKTDTKPKKRDRVAKKYQTRSNGENRNDEDDENEDSPCDPSDDHGQVKRRRYERRIPEKKEYNLRTRSEPVNYSSESDGLNRDSTFDMRENHHHTYKTRSWYRHNANRIDDDGVMTNMNEQTDGAIKETTIESSE